MWMYLAILVILFLSCFKKIEGFEEKKGVLVLYGESFRTGNLGSRERDCDECIESQKLASKSHTDFIQYVKEKYNITMDVLINTYDTKYEDQLKSYYNSPQYYSHKELLGWDKMCQTAVDKIDKTKYEFILLTRADILIKPEFYSVFNPSWEKLYFLSPVEKTADVCGFSKNETVYYPQINPIFMFFPSKYFYTLQQINAGHHAWNHFMEIHKLTEEDMGFMVDYQFNTNSSKIQNSYYKMIGRPESSSIMDKNDMIQYPLIKTTTPVC